MNFSVDNEEKSKGIGVIILLFIALIVLVSNSNLRDKIFVFINKDSEDLEASKSFNIEDCESVGAFKDVILSYNNDQLIGYNLEGKEIFSKDISYDNNIVAYGTEYAYVGDRTSGKISKFNSKGQEEWSYIAEGSLEYILERNQNLIILTKIEDIQGINVLNDKGKSITKLIVEDSSVFDCDIKDDDKTIIIGSFKISDEGIVSILKYYSYSGELLWEKIFHNEIIQKVKFIDGDNIVSFTDNKIYSISSSESLLWSKDINGNIKDILIDDNAKKMVLLSKDNSNYLEVINYNGRVDKKVKLNINVDKIYSYNEDIILYGKDNILKIDSDGNEKVYTKENIDYIYSINDYIVIFSKGEVKVINWTRL